MIIASLVGLAIYLAITEPKGSTLFIVVCMACYQAAAAFSATLFIPAMGQQRMMGPALAEFSVRTLAFAIVAGCIYGLHTSLAHAMAAFIVSGLLFVSLAVRSARTHGGSLSVVVSLTSAKRILRILWSFAAIEVFAQLFTRVGIIALTLGVSDSAAGVYATGLRLIEVGLMPLAFLGIAVYPRLSQLFRADLPVFRQMGENLLWGTMLIVGALGWGLYYVAPLLLVPVLGTKYEASIPVVKIMAALGLVQGCEIALGRLLLSADLQTVRAASIVIGALCALVLNLVLVPKFGLDGAIVATVASYLIIGTLYFKALAKQMGTVSLLRVFATLLLATATTVAISWVCQTEHIPYWGQAAAAAVGFVIVCAAGFALSSVPRPRATALQA